MSEWAAKRFWTEALVVPAPGGYEVRLDARILRTPLKSPLVLPTAAMAEAVAAEWAAAGELIDPRAMPVTRSANSAVDKVATQRGEVADLLAEYGATDLLCYRAGAPEALVERQAGAWDPFLDWAREAHGAALRTTTGVMPIAQDPKALACLRAPLDAADAFALTALHDLIALSGSLVIGLAVADAAWETDAAWTASRLDELWQFEQWGEDFDAVALAERKRGDFLHAARFLSLSRGRAAPPGARRPTRAGAQSVGSAGSRGTSLP